MDKLPLVEIFKSIQGEGRYQGYPVVFVRLSGCTRRCTFCDTAYHTKGKMVDVEELAKKIASFGIDTVVWTGGEPLLYIDRIIQVKKLLLNKTKFHIETNGDLVKTYSCDFWVKTKSGDISLLSIFDYLCISPKEFKVAKEVSNSKMWPGKFDIKVVTDFKTYGMDMVPYASMLMPLSTYTKKDRAIRQRVWNYCVEHNLLYSGRLHVEVWKKTQRK